MGYIQKKAGSNYQEVHQYQTKSRYNVGSLQENDCTEVAQISKQYICFAQKNKTKTIQQDVHSTKTDSSNENKIKKTLREKRIPWPERPNSFTKVSNS